MKLRIALGSGLVLLLATLAGVAYAAKGGVFEGAWQAIDGADGSNEWMWIRNFSGVHEVLMYDDACTACPDAEDPSITHPCVIVSSGQAPENSLWLDGAVVTCVTPEGLEAFTRSLAGVEFQYVPGVGILDPWNTTWTPSKDKKPEKLIP